MSRPAYSKALVYSGSLGSLELREIPIPKLDAEQALIRVTGCTVCGSDVHSLHGRRQVPTPIILGHEIVGEIVEMGSMFTRSDMQNNPLQLGDQITWAIVANCGSCFYCTRGLEQKCEKAFKYGHMGFDSHNDLSGGLAEYCVLVSGTRTLKLPSDAKLEVFTPANCATATIVAAFDGLPAPPSHDSHIAIVGAGMLGLTACSIASARGWKRIVAIDPVEVKRDVALRFGATHSVSPDEWLADSVSSKSYGCDAVIEVSGAVSMIVPAIESLRIGGQIVLVGSVFPVPPVSLLPERLIRNQWTLRGIHNYRPEHLQKAIQFLNEYGKEFPFAELVPSWHALSEVETLVRQGLPSNVVRLGVKP